MTTPRPPLQRAGRRTYIAGGIAFIFIGLVHTATQLTTLSSDTVKAQYRAGGDIAVSGELVDGWHLFAGTSLLMGVFSLALGAMTLGVLRELGRPLASVCAVNIAALIGVAIVGYAHLSWLQLYGGIVGVILFGIPLVSARGR